MHLTLYALSAREDPDLLAATLRIAPAAVVGSVLIIAAGFVSTGLRPVLWVPALAVGFFGPLITGVSGWRVRPAHFTERHGLIVIIAIGESLVAIGVGAKGTTLDAGVMAAAVLGLVVAMSLWLAYFDFFTVRAQQVLGERRGGERIALAPAPTRTCISRWSPASSCSRSR